MVAPLRLRIARALLPLVCMPMASSCHVHEYHVGAGAVGVGEESMRQYYLFLGLVRLNDADPQRIAFGKPSFTVRSAFEFSDFFVTALLLPLSVTTRTVTVRW